MTFVRGILRFEQIIKIEYRTPLLEYAFTIISACHHSIIFIGVPLPQPRPSGPQK